MITVVLKSGVGAYVADQQVLADLDASGLVVARYADGSPNGSASDIAGIASAAGNVVGLMPHPEHAIDPLTGPGMGGLDFFASVLAPRGRGMSRPDTVADAGATPGRGQPHAALGLTDAEYASIGTHLGRRPTDSELAIYSVMWSEHCSYKSSRVHLRQFAEKAPPTAGAAGRHR